MTTPQSAGDLGQALSDFRRITEVALARIEGQIALLVQRSEQTDKMLDEVEQRINALERVKWAAVGAGVVLGGGAGALTQVFVK